MKFGSRMTPGPPTVQGQRRIFSQNNGPEAPLHTATLSRIPVPPFPNFPWAKPVSSLFPEKFGSEGPPLPRKSRSCLPGPPASSGGRPWIRVTRARAGRGRGEARVRDGRGKNEHGPVLIQLPPLPRRHRPSQEPFLVCQQFLLHTGFLHDSQSLGGGQEAVRIPGGDFLGHRQCPWGGGRQPEPAPEASEALWLNRGFRVFTPVCGCQLPKLLTVEKVITWLRLRSLLRTFTQRKQEDRHLAGECAPNGRRPKSMPEPSQRREWPSPSSRAAGRLGHLSESRFPQISPLEIFRKRISLHAELVSGCRNRAPPAKTRPLRGSQVQLREHQRPAVSEPLLLTWKMQHGSAVGKLVLQKFKYSQSSRAPGT